MTDSTEELLRVWFRPRPRRGFERAVRTGNEVQAYIDYDRYYAAAAAAIDSAGPGGLVILVGHELGIDTPVTVGGRVEQIGTVLARAGARGADVRALLSGHLGNANNPAVTWLVGRRGCSALLDDRLRLPGAFHQKGLVVSSASGLVAFVGGMDIAAGRLARPEKGEGPWHDVHVRVTGLAAHDVLETVSGRWNSHHWGRENPVPRQLGQRGGRRPLRAVQVVHTYGNPETGRSLTQLRPDAGRPSMSEAYDRLAHPEFAFAPQGETSIHDALVHAIRATKETIYVEDQYFVASSKINGGEELLSALAETVARPSFKHLLVLTCGVGTIQGELYQTNRRRQALWRRIAAAHPDRVSVWTYKSNQQRCYWVHSKTWLFDDTLAIVGSANFNRRGLTHDGELGVVILDAQPSEHWVRDLRVALWAKHLPTQTRPVDPAQLTDFETGRKLWVDSKDTLLTRLDLEAGDPYQPDHLVLCTGAVPPGRWGRLARSVVCEHAPRLGIPTNTPDGQWDLAIDPDGS